VSMTGKIRKVLEKNADPSKNYAVPEVVSANAAPVPRAEGGKFLKGHSGNPAGRVKGLRNKITLERLLLEDVLRQTLVSKSPALLNKAIKMAMGGNDRVMRALLDKVLATPKHDDAGEAKDNEIKILIQNMTASPSPMSEPGVTAVVVTPTKTQVNRNG
jgi:hypothetical protein